MTLYHLTQQTYGSRIKSRPIQKSRIAKVPGLQAPSNSEGKLAHSNVLKLYLNG